MALQIDINSNIGQEFENAYVVVDEYSCDKNDIIQARIRAYINREKYHEGCEFIGGSEEVITLVCDYGDDATNTKKQIYTHIKSLDKYLNATDVLE